MKITLSNRLNKISNFVKPYRNIVDIGTDHCLVPISLMLKKEIDYAIATDINEGPIKEAVKNVKFYKLENHIDIRQGNGLCPISENDNLDVIIISGMGGLLITDILNTGKDILHLNKRLILQPNIHEEYVRRWLMENAYEIVLEDMVYEDGIYYEIIVGDKHPFRIDYSMKELKFGPLLLKSKNHLFREKWQKILAKKEETIINIPNNHKKKRNFADEIELIKEVLDG